MDEQNENILNENIGDAAEKTCGFAGEETPFPEYVMPLKKETAFTRGEQVMAFAAIVLAFFFVHLVLWNISGFFTTLLYIAIITVSLLYMKKSGCEFSPFNRATAGVLYLFSFVFSVTANSLIKFLDVVFLLVGGAYFVYSVCSQSRQVGRFMPFEIFKSLLEYPFAHFGKELRAINFTVKKTAVGGSVKFVAAGLVVAVPLTCIVGSLLMSADSGVERILGGIAEFLHAQNVWSLLVQLGVSVPAACWLFGMFYSNLHRDEVEPLSEEECQAAVDRARKINNTAVYTAVTPICLLYALFFLSQANYFLSAFSGRLPADYSYADYARRGFFELFAIELINAAVIAFMNFFSQKSGKDKPKALKFYTLVISVFTLLITATAVSKMVMYIDNYGFTQLRLYTTWFMVLTALMFVYVIIRQFRSSFSFANAAAVTFTVMFALLCFSRPDAIIAKCNLEFYGDIMTAEDIDIMSGMSDDAVSVLLDSKYSGLLRSLGVPDVMTDDNGRQYTSDTPVFEKIKHDTAEKYENDPYARYNLSAVIAQSRL